MRSHVPGVVIGTTQNLWTAVRCDEKRAPPCFGSRALTRAQQGRLNIVARARSQRRSSGVS
eukprot:scaffold39597_cov69-Phaeocystis_antarctica.AAC.4